ncbi:MAG: sigma-70 family RNA polymerase sigma factor [Lautropia sp.]
MSGIEFALRQRVESLYSDHHGWLQGWLRRRLGDAFVAADLTQDAFVAVISASSATEIREPRPFLVTIARRLMAHHHRRQLLEASYLELLAALPEEQAPSPEARLQALQALQQLDRALDGLPPKVKEAFLLAHLEELSYAEIAGRLGVSASSVKQYLTRANRQCLFSITLQPDAADR